MDAFNYPSKLRGKSVCIAKIWKVIFMVMTIGDSIVSAK